MQKRGDQVFAGIDTAFRHELAEVDNEFFDGLLLAWYVVGELKDISDPAGEGVGHRIGDAEHETDDADGICWA